MQLSLDDHLADTPEWTHNLGAQYAWTLPSDAGTLRARLDGAFRTKVYKDPCNLGRGVNVFGAADVRTTPTPAIIADGYQVNHPEISQPGFW